MYVQSLPRALPTGTPHTAGDAPAAEVVVVQARRESSPGEPGDVSLALPIAYVRRAARALHRPFRVLDVPRRITTADEFLCALVRRLAGGGGAQPPESHEYREQLTGMIAVHVLAHYSAASEQGGGGGLRGGLSPATLRRVRAYVGEHLGDPLPHHVLAERAGLSPWHFAREFKRTTGETPAAYVKRVRMARARVLLADPHYRRVSVSAVAEEVGYRSASAFSRAFSRQYGVGPTEYRREISRADEP